MPTAITTIEARRLDIRTQANADWVATIPIRRAGQGGVVAGAGNAGNGALSLASVAPDTALGAHLVTVTAPGSPARITVQGPDGSVTGQSAVGLATSAGGILFTLAAGSSAFAVGDSFAIGVLPVPVDLTGIAFDLQARVSPDAATIALSATSHPADPTEAATITVDAVAGTLALRIPRLAMAADQLPPGAYVYDILASADGLTVPVVYGAITHVQGVSRLG